MARQTRNETVAVTTSSSQVANEVVGMARRKAIVISNIDTTQSITLTKGPQPAVANAGIVLAPGGVFSESEDSNYACWQGAYQVVSTGSSNIAVSEDISQ